MLGLSFRKRNATAGLNCYFTGKSYRDLGYWCWGTWLQFSAMNMEVYMDNMQTSQ